MKPGHGRELHTVLAYDQDDKARLLKLVVAFRKQQDKGFARLPDRELARMLRDHLADHDFVGHIADGWYVVQSGDPDDPIKEVVQRSWLVVDNKYIVDTCADRSHPEEEGYKVVITRIGVNKNYSDIRPSKSAARFNAKVKNFIKNPLKRRGEGISESK